MVGKKKEVSSIQNVQGNQMIIDEAVTNDDKEIIDSAVKVIKDKTQHIKDLRDKITEATDDVVSVLERRHRMEVITNNYHITLKDKKNIKIKNL